MVRYFYAWTPLTIVAAVVFLALPWLGLIALMVVAFVALGALVWLALAIGSAVATATRAIAHGWHAQAGARPATAPVQPAPAMLVANARANREA
jgi:hypothetical protein